MLYSFCDVLKVCHIAAVNDFCTRASRSSLVLGLNYGIGSHLRLGFGSDMGSSISHSLFMRSTSGAMLRMRMMRIAIPRNSIISVAEVKMRPMITVQPSSVSWPEVLQATPTLRQGIPKWF